jgi:hypothetical protein
MVLRLGEHLHAERGLGQGRERKAERARAVVLDQEADRQTDFLLGKKVAARS